MWVAERQLWLHFLCLSLYKHKVSDSIVLYIYLYIYFFFYLAATTTTWNSSASLWGNCRHKNKFNSLTLKIVYPEGIYKCQTWQVFRVSGLTSPSICYWVLYCWFCGFWFFFPLAVKYISSFLWYVSMILLFCCVSFFFKTRICFTWFLCLQQ